MISTGKRAHVLGDTYDYQRGYLQLSRIAVAKKLLIGGWLHTHVVNVNVPGLLYSDKFQFKACIQWKIARWIPLIYLK